VLEVGRILFACAPWDPPGDGCPTCGDASETADEREVSDAGDAKRPVRTLYWKSAREAQPNGLITDGC